MDFLLVIFSLFSKNAGRRIRFLIAGLIGFIFFSNSFIIGKVFNAYECGYPIDQKYDVGIVLGGFSKINKRNNAIAIGWSGDRLFQAISLYKTGKISKILITSGSANLNDTKIKEGDLVYDYLIKIGIPDSDLLIEDQSRNTIENAALSFKLVHDLQANAKVLIITSAWHIPRTKLAFSKYFGNQVAYYPANYKGQTDHYLSDYLIPIADALGNWELNFKEWVGLLVDKFRA